MAVFLKSKILLVDNISHLFKYRLSRCSDKLCLPVINTIILFLWNLFFMYKRMLIIYLLYLREDDVIMLFTWAIFFSYQIKFIFCLLYNEQTLNCGNVFFYSVRNCLDLFVANNLKYQAQCFTHPVEAISLGRIKMNMYL